MSDLVGNMKNNLEIYLKMYKTLSIYYYQQQDLELRKFAKYIKHKLTRFLVLFCFVVVRIVISIVIHYFYVFKSNIHSLSL